MDCYKKIEKEVYDCQHKQDTCTRNLRNIAMATKDKMKVGVHLDTRNLQQTFTDHIPKNMTHGYYGVDGQYHKL